MSVKMLLRLQIIDTVQSLGIRVVLSVMGFNDFFSFQIFFIFLRESLEIVIIVSILLTIVKQGLSIDSNDRKAIGSGSTYNNNFESSTARLNEPSVVNSPFTAEEERQIYDNAEELQTALNSPEVTTDNVKLYKKLKTQIIFGGALGLGVCMVIGSIFILVFYHVGTDLWTLSEHYYEGVLSLMASLIISIMGLFFLRLGKLREKFRIKLASIVYSNRNTLFQEEENLQIRKHRNVKFTKKYAFFILPFVTSLREGLEAVVFIGGIGIDQPLTSIPLSMVASATLSGIFGHYFFKYSTSLSLKICLVVTTCFLYLIAAGLFSKGIWQLELQDYVNKCNGQDMTEVGNGPGSYDISRSVWHVNCCNGDRDGGWMILTAIFGWTNSATYGSVISYNVYWIAMILVMNIVMIKDKYGYIPYVPIKWQKRQIMKQINIAKASISLAQTAQADSTFIPEGSGSRSSSDSATPLIDRSKSLTVPAEDSE